MRYIVVLFLLIFSACSSSTVDEITKRVKDKNYSLTKDDSVKYFFYTEDFDKATTEPNAEAESDYYYTLKFSKDKLIDFNHFIKSNIIKKTDKYIFMLLNINDDSNALAATFSHDGSPINFLLLENNFGNNEFSVNRTYKIIQKDTIIISDERYDTEWIVHPTNGINKLTRKSDIKIAINKQGYFFEKH